MHEGTDSPVIVAIDGTSASGKGTIARMLAEYFSFKYLNSGALYRMVAFISEKENISLDNISGLTEIAKNLSPTFDGKKVIVENKDIWPIISKQEYGNLAAIISPIPELREALHEFQRSMIGYPGIVAEGRDMCTVVFTDAQHKFYLDAQVEIRARRRYDDEILDGSPNSYDKILEELVDRDSRDKNRAVGRLFPAEDAITIDTGRMTVKEVFDYCVSIINK